MLSKSSVFQSFRPLENRTKWRLFCQPLENRTPIGKQNKTPTIWIPNSEWFWNSDKKVRILNFLIVRTIAIFNPIFKKSRFLDGCSSDPHCNIFNLPGFGTKWHPKRLISDLSSHLTFYPLSTWIVKLQCWSEQSFDFLSFEYLNSKTPVFRCFRVQ